MNFNTWLFGPREIKVDMSDRVVSPYLHVEKMIDTDNLLDCRRTAQSNMEKRYFKQKIGRIYGGETFIIVEFDFTRGEL